MSAFRDSQLHDETNIPWEPYLTGLDQSGEYVSRHTDTGNLLNSSLGDFYTIKKEHDMSLFDEYEGQFVNGKREGYGIYRVLDISDSQNYLTYEGEFKNNLPDGKGKLVRQIGNLYLTEITGYFKQGVPDTDQVAVITHHERGFITKKYKMEGLISYSAWSKSEITQILDSNKPYNLIRVYTDFDFLVKGTRVLEIYEPPKSGVFNSRGIEQQLSGGRRSKKRLNYKRKHSHK